MCRWWIAERVRSGHDGFPIRGVRGGVRHDSSEIRRIKGTSRMDSVLDIAEGSRGQDRNGYRKEFISLVQKARNLGR